MGLKGMEPIQFDFAAATALAAQFKATAGLLEGQVPRRNAVADVARKDWRGSYEEKFRVRMQGCVKDAGALAAAMKEAASQVEALAAEAKKEQERRAKAREHQQAHDIWEKRQGEKWLLERWINVNDPEPPLPETKDVQPPKLPIKTPPVGPRE